jgi:hypothetical protein
MASTSERPWLSRPDLSPSKSRQPEQNESTMIGILVKAIESFLSEAAKLLAGKAFKSQPSLCKEILRLYLSLEELTDKASVIYKSLESFTAQYEVLKNNKDLQIQIRQEARDLLDSLKRFEAELKGVFVKLKLVGGQELSVTLVKVPEASYTLFKKYFVEDLAPTFVADPEGRKYVFRIVVENQKYELVNSDKLGRLSLDLDRLFEEGKIGYAIIDFSDRQQTAQMLRDCRQDLSRLRAASESLAETLKQNCDLKTIL